MYQYTPESIYGLCLPVVKPDPEPGYDANGSPVTDQRGCGDYTPLRRLEFCRYISEEINPRRVARGLGCINELEALHAFNIINKFIADWRLSCEEFANERLSRDLIEAARDAQGG